MPSLGADMASGTLVQWLVKSGDRVKRGDIVAVVETQKGAIEVEIFEDGKVEKVLVDLGAVVPVGMPLAVITTDGEGAARPAPSLSAAPNAAPKQQLPTEASPTAMPSGGSVRISPAARRLAQSKKLDLSGITGSGPGGSIVFADVEKLTGKIAVDVSPAQKPMGLDLKAMRSAIAAAMTRSKKEIPHYYLQHQVDISDTEAWLSRINTERAPSDRLLMGALFLKAVALACQQFPTFNGHYADGAFKPSAAVHAGVAVAIRGGGLAAPAIHDAEALGLDALMAKMRDLVGRMRVGRIRSSEIADATITVSSLGERGVEAFYAVIYPPQTAIIGVGKIVRRPWIVNDAVVARSVVTLTLSADHRVSDGHDGALFLAQIGRRLLEPEKL